MTDPLERPKRRLPGERHQENSLRADREDPDPPRQTPQLPVELAAHEGERELQADHDDDRWGSLPPRLESFLRPCLALTVDTAILVHAPVAATARVVRRHLPRGPGRRLGRIGGT